MRDRLKKLYYEAKCKYMENKMSNKNIGSETDFIIDNLIENGVIVPPCRIDDIVYFIHRNEILSGKCKSYNNGHFVTVWVDSHNLNYAIANIDFGQSAFLTKEEAEKALRGEGENVLS